MISINNDKNLLISIIVPVYKVEPYLRRCVDSILNQTFENLEIILIDDGSPDFCGNICDEYAEKDKRIKTIHKLNGGLSSARNAGLDICKGDYIMFVDSDDWVEPNFCEAALQLALTKKVDCVAFGYYEHQDNKRIPFHTNQPRIIGTEEAIIHLIRIDEVIFNLAWNKIYHRRLFDNLRYPVGRLYEDQGTTYKAFIRAEKIYVSDLVLYNYDRREDSITGSKNISRLVNDKFDSWCERLEVFKNYSQTLYKEEMKHIALYSVKALKFIDWKKDKKLKLKLSEFLQANKERIIKMNINSKSLFLYYNSYFLFEMLKKLGVFNSMSKDSIL